MDPEGDETQADEQASGSLDSGAKADLGPVEAPPRADSPVETARDIAERAETISHHPAGPESAVRGRAGSTSAPILDIDQFMRALLDYGLIDDADLREFIDSLPPASRPRDASGLARELVRARRLTPYQAAAVSQDKAKGLVLGNYLVLDKLGAGGMGIVFKATHRRLKRVVALKLLPPSVTRYPEAVHRFHREAEAAAKLSHPNIVSALDADEYQGLHFLVMEYVEGGDLARLVASNGPLPVGQAVDCIAQAARGLQAAHERGIIHRDIKPANLLLDPRGTVKVLDLGLARFADPLGLAGAPEARNVLTQSGSFMGTVDYMSPEQAYNPSSADELSDIYSLGCSLYFLLTGAPPYPGNSLMQRLLAHREHPVPAAGAIRPGIPPALDDLVGRMMAKDTLARPQSMGEVVAALEAIRPALPVAAGPAGPSPSVSGPDQTNPDRRGSGVGPSSGPEPQEADRLTSVSSDLGAKEIPDGRSGRPPRLIAYALALAAVLLPISLVVFRAIGPVGRRDPVRPAPIGEGSPPVVKDAPDLARPDPPRPTDEVPPVEIETSRLQVPDTPAEVRRYVGHEHPFVHAVAVSPDGRRFLSCGQDQTIRLREIDGAEEILHFAHDGPVYHVAFAPDGRHALSASGDRTVRYWDVDKGEEIRRLGTHESRVYTVAFSPDGRRAVTGEGDGTVKVWDVETGGELDQFDHEEGAVVAVAFAPDGRRVLSGGEDGTVRLWDLATRAEIRHFDAGAPVCCLAISPDGHRALSGGSDGLLKLWGLDTRSEVRLEGHREWARCVTFTADGRHALSGDLTGRLILWDLEDGRHLSQLDGPVGYLGVALLPDGRQALTADADGSVRLWQLPLAVPPAGPSTLSAPSPEAETPPPSHAPGPHSPPPG